MKSAASSEPTPGSYRIARGICIVNDQAICDYPLRTIRLSTTVKRLLLLCTEPRTCRELAEYLNQPVRRIEMLCEQLQWKGLLDAGPKLPPERWPGVSIIIPSYNRARQLERCLRALFAVEYPASCMEIIVVDDASTDETSTLLQRFAQEFTAQGKTMRVFRHSHQLGVAKSRNSGAELAESELLAYIDSDCVASQGWLAELVPAFQDSSIGAVGGMIRAYERQSMLGRYEDRRSSLFMGVRPQQIRLEGPLTYIPTANVVVRRAVWESIGGFAPLTFGEDVDFCRRLLAHGWHMLYLPRGVVYHDYRTNLWAFLKIHASYASAEAALLRRHPAERRVLVLPPEQAMFAGLVLGGMWWTALRTVMRKPYLIPPRGYIRSAYSNRSIVGATLVVALREGGVALREGGIALTTPFLAFLLTLFGLRNRLKMVLAHHIPISPFTIFRATLRSHLAYTYHLCRHLTRYYTLLLLIVGVFLPPLLLLALILCTIVVVVDYMRLRPDMSLGKYALCSVLDDCAYEVGVVMGCIKQRTWKPLMPIVKRKNPSRARIPGP